jgi:hypothetical protein
MGARNKIGIGLSYQPARLHRLTESIILGSLKVWKFWLRLELTRKIRDFQGFNPAELGWRF